MTLNRSLVVSALLILFVGLGVSRPAARLVENLLATAEGMKANGSVSQNYDKKLETDGKIKQLEQENSSLQKALELKQNSQYKLVSAYVSGRSNSLLLKYLRINKGSSQGIELDQAVLANGIVIGKIDSVVQDSSKVILNEDQAFRLEVEFSGNRGVLKGLINGAVIDRVLPNATIKKNDLVVTTAQPNKIPAGLTVGRVVAELDSGNEAFKQVQISGYEDAWRTHLVQVVISEK